MSLPGPPAAEIAAQLDVSEKRMRAIIRDPQTGIRGLVSRMPAPPEEFVAIQVSRLNEALNLAHSAPTSPPSRKSIACSESRASSTAITGSAWPSSAALPRRAWRRPPKTRSPSACRWSDAPNPRRKSVPWSTSRPKSRFPRKGRTCRRRSGGPGLRRMTPSPAPLRWPIARKTDCKALKTLIPRPEFGAPAPPRRKASACRRSGHLVPQTAAAGDPRLPGARHSTPGK